MNTMFIVNLGVLLLAVFLMSLQVAQAQVTKNVTNVTTANGCGRTEASALLLPLALAASVLYGWS